MESWEEAVRWLRDQPDQSELVVASYFDDPLRAAADRYSRSSEWSAIRVLLPANVGRALDLGAGRGIASFALAQDGWQVTALEPDPSDLVGAGAIRALAQESGQRIEVVTEQGEALPFAEGCFDLVFGRQVLHHAADLHAICREAHRVLRPGGVFLAVREHVVSRPEDLPVFLQRHPLHYRYGGENAHPLSAYLDAIRSAGFRVDRVLNPWQSEINTFPESMLQIQRRLAQRLHLPTFLVSRTMLGWIGSWSNAPGRLYSFLATKGSHG